MDWHSVFDETYPEPGASVAELERLVAAIGQPLSAGETEAVNLTQRNPFPNLQANSYLDAHVEEIHYIMTPKQAEFLSRLAKDASEKAEGSQSEDCEGLRAAKSSWPG